MVNRNVLIGVAVLVIILLGAIYFSGMTGNAITGSSINTEKVENQYFKINDTSRQTNKEVSLNDTQNNSKSG